MYKLRSRPSTSNVVNVDRTTSLKACCSIGKKHPTRCSSLVHCGLLDMLYPLLTSQGSKVEHGGHPVPECDHEGQTTDSGYSSCPRIPNTYLLTVWIKLTARFIMPYTDLPSLSCRPAINPGSTMPSEWKVAAGVEGGCISWSKHSPEPWDVQYMSYSDHANPHSSPLRRGMGGTGHDHRSTGCDVSSCSASSGT